MPLRSTRGTTSHGYRLDLIVTAEVPVAGFGTARATARAGPVGEVATGTRT